ncbi:hypothetical protein B9Z55_006667 [Caenorhabditis nigoni]|nr:hypothetical protein B9Z55_006667 [Caenorhabditis nigoni]
MKSKFGVNPGTSAPPIDHPGGGSSTVPPHQASSDPSFLDKIKAKLGGRTIIPVPIPLPHHDSADPSFLDKIKAKLGIGHQNLEFSTSTTQESTTPYIVTTSSSPPTTPQPSEPGFFGKAFAKLKSMLNIDSTDPAKPNLVVKYGKKAVENWVPNFWKKSKRFRTLDLSKKFIFFSSLFTFHESFQNFHGMNSFFSTDEEFPTQLQNFEGRTQTEIRTLREKVERLEKLVEGLQSILMKEWNVTESGSKYRLFEERKNWDNAEKHCQGFGAHLAIIDNEAKNTFVTNLINSSETSDFAWIGMKTKTSTQTSTPFTNFDSESPIDGCAVMDSKGVWSIRSCIQLRPFVCQIIKTDTESRKVTQKAKPAPPPPPPPKKDKSWVRSKIDSAKEKYEAGKQKIKTKVEHAKEKYEHAKEKVKSKLSKSGDAKNAFVQKTTPRINTDFHLKTTKSYGWNPNAHYGGDSILTTKKPLFDRIKEKAKGSEKYVGKAVGWAKKDLGIGVEGPKKPSKILKFGKKAVEFVFKKKAKKTPQVGFSNAGVGYTGGSYAGGSYSQGYSNPESSDLHQKVEYLRSRLEVMQDKIQGTWNTSEAGTKYKLFEDRKNWNDAQVVFNFLNEIPKIRIWNLESWNLECGIWNVESGIWNLESGIWNLESGIWNLESGIWNLESGIWNLESGIWNLESGIWNLESGIWNLESGIWNLESGIWNLESGIWNLESGIWNLESGIWNLESGIWNLESGIWNLESGIWNLESGIWNLESGIWNLESGIWNLESGIWNLESGIWNLESGIWNLESGIWNLESGIWNLESGIWNLDILDAHPSSFFLFQLHCEELGSNLAYLDSESKNNYAKLLLNESQNTTMVWFGLRTEIGLESASQPQNQFSNFAHLDGCGAVDRNGTWTISACTIELPYLCQAFRFDVLVEIP